MAERGGGRLAALFAVVLFAGLAAFPWLYTANGVPPWAQMVPTTATASLSNSPADLPPVQLQPVAQPINPEQAPAVAPVVDSAHSAALVVSEDQRIRTLLHHSSRLTRPTVVSTPRTLPTLILPPRPSPYGLGDLIANGAAVPKPSNGTYLLVDSVLVAPDAVLNLGGPGFTSLRMNSTAAGFTSLVTWAGTITIAGTPQAPLSVTGWDQVALSRGIARRIHTGYEPGDPAVSQPSVDIGAGRPYIRDIGGKLTLDNVRVSSLGFWSGRTGGVAWTGINQRPATGGAASSTFIDDAYGAFVSNASQIAFTSDLFENSEVDGMLLHRGAQGIAVTGSTAARNGGSGFVVSRGSTGDVLRGDVALHNAQNGFLLNGQPLVSGTSASGNIASASVGTVITGSRSEKNVHTGILVEGGVGTQISRNYVCGPISGIALRLGAIDTTVSGNYVACNGDVGLSIGPSVVGTAVQANRFEGARIGILIRSSPGVRILNDQFVGISVFAISSRGASPGVVGSNNTMSGVGLAPIETQSGAPQPVLTNTDLRAWERRSNVTVLSYLRFHPLLTTWLSILILISVFWFATRMRRRPIRPYAHSMAWQRLGYTGKAITYASATEYPANGHPVAGQPVNGYPSNGHEANGLAVIGHATNGHSAPAVSDAAGDPATPVAT
jgi:Right handed beta helix region